MRQKNRNPTSFRFTHAGYALLEKMSLESGLSKRSMLEILIREEAKRQGIDILALDLSEYGPVKEHDFDTDS